MHSAALPREKIDRVRIRRSNICSVLAGSLPEMAIDGPERRLINPALGSPGLPRRTPSLDDEIGLGVFLGLLLLVLKAPMVFFPSQDDVAPLYEFYVKGSLGTAFADNLALVRLIVLPAYAIADALSLPHFVVALAASVLVDASWATLAIVLFRRVDRDIPSTMLVPLVIVSCLSPGLLGLGVFWNVRLNLLLANAALVAFVLAWFRWPDRRAMLAFATVLATMLLYPGSVSVALLIVVILFARDLQDEGHSPRKFISLVLGVCIAIIVAAAVFAVIVRIVADTWGVYGGKFSFIPLREIFAKLTVIAEILQDQIVGTTTSAATIGLLALSAATLAASNPGRYSARYWASLVFAVCGLLLVGLQLPSLPVAQDWYPPRTFLFLFFGFASIVVLAARHTQIGRVPMASVWAAAIIAILVATYWSFSYAQMRARDFETAAEIAADLRHTGFDWKRPIVVDFGDWRRYTKWNGGMDGRDTASLLSQPWASSALVALLAKRQFIDPSQEMRDSARIACEQDRPEYIEIRIIERNDFVAVCL